jgi:flagellar hook-associated protein 2
MATSLNLNSLTVDQSGRASFSGLGTGIDIQGTVDKIIAAKRVPIDRIEQRISDNQAKIAALQDLRSYALGLKTAAEKLRGKVSFDGSADIFEAKQAFATASRADSQTPSAADSLIGVTVTNAAQATSHSVEVLQVATAHKVASGSIASRLNDPLGLSGSFQINGQEITVAATDTLLALRDRINAANAGDDATGVTASIVSISATEQVLILTADQTGTDSAITAADTSGSVLQDLGIVDGTGAFQSELRQAQNAQIQVDGLGTTIERQSNTIDDVFAGVTLSLYKAEPGTTLKLDVERDLNQVKSAIVDFVDAYNQLRTYINQQALTNVPEDDDTGAGILAGTSALSQARSELAAAIGAAVDDTDPTFAVLAQIGITIQAPGQVSDPTQANTLAIDESKLDEALLNQTAAVRSLFSFQMSSSSSDVVLAGFDGNTSYSASGYTLNVAYSGGQIVSANVNGPADGSDDGSVVVDGKVLKAASGGAKGLQLLYTGTASASGIQLDLSVGIGAKLYDTVDAMIDDKSGPLANEVDNLEGQNDLGQDRIDRLQARLDREHDRLLQRFAAMETALTSMNQLLESLRQQIDAAFNGNSRNS